MKCSESQRLLPDYTTGNLTPAALKELEAHLAVCPACADSAGRRTAHAIRGDAGAVRDPSGV